MTTTAVRRLAALAAYRVEQRKRGDNAPPEVLAARTSLADYGRYVHGFEPEPFHLDWIASLEDPTIDRLLIVAPPDHAKTQYAVLHLAEYLIGNNPDIHILVLSNTSGQANRKGVGARNTIAHNPRYHAVFPGIKPDPLKWAEHEWKVQRADPGDKDATLLSAGLFGPITGSRADIILYDDINDEENTATAYQREKAQQWIESTAMSRLVTGGRAIGIMTRWHHRDMAQVWMDEGWTVLNYPALNDHDEALWESRNPASKLMAERALHPLTFERVYQGRPTAQEGALIKEQWWRYYTEAPTFTRTIQILDTAFKTGTLNDYSVDATWGLAENGVYLLDVEEGKWEYPELKRRAVTAFMRHAPDVVLVEDAASGQSLIQDLQETTLMPVRAVKVDRDKVSRVNAILDYIAAGRVYLPESAPWLARFIRQHSEFPLGENDDIVDTTAMAISELLTGVVAAEAVTDRVNPWARERHTMWGRR